MKSILEFNLPEEQSDFLLATRGSKLYSALWEIQQYLRNLEKYGHTHKTPEDLLEAIRTYVHEEIGTLLDDIP